MVNKIGGLEKSASFRKVSTSAKQRSVDPKKDKETIGSSASGEIRGANPSHASHIVPPQAPSPTASSKLKDSIATDPQLSPLTEAGVGATVAFLDLAGSMPFTTAKTLLHNGETLRTLGRAARHNPLSLYSGFGSMYVAYAPGLALFSGLKSIGDGVLARNAHDISDASRHGLSTSVSAAIVSMAWTTPFESVMVKQQTAMAKSHGRVKPSMPSIMKKVLRTEGPKGLWKGASPTVMRELIYLNMLFSPQIVRDQVLTESMVDKHPLGSKFITALGMGTAGAVATNGPDLVKSRMQASYAPERPTLVLRNIVKQEGLGVLLKGAGTRSVGYTIATLIVDTARTKIRAKLGSNTAESAQSAQSAQ